MNTAGKLVYELYVKAQLDLNNCECAAWDTLDIKEQRVWAEVVVRFESYLLS